MSLQLFQSPWPRELQDSSYTQIGWKVFNTATLRTPLHHLLAQKINPATKKEPLVENNYSNLRSQLTKPKGDYKATLVQFKAADGTVLEGVLIPASLPGKKVILFAPGEEERYESIAQSKKSAHHFIAFFKQAFTDHAILIINTRGIGNSKGKASLEGSSLDYYAAWSFLEKQGFEKILPWGHSLGGKYLLFLLQHGNRGKIPIKKSTSSLTALLTISPLSLNIRGILEL